MGKLIIKGGKAILPGQITEGVDLVCADGKIAAVVPHDSVAADSSDMVIDAAGQYVSPGFIDLHVHGGGGHDFLDGTVEAFLGALKAHARHGTTAIAPTTATCPNEDLFGCFETYRKVQSLNKEGARPIGLHLEGPFFSLAKSGAQDPKFLQLPVPENYLPILDASDDIVRVSVAPELEGAYGLGDELAKRGIVASIAHTDSTCAQCEEAHRHGYSLMTHFYCAMSTIVKKNCYRIAGAVEAGYLIDDMDVEIIADGCHLPAEVLRYVYKFKGSDRTTLCTDALRPAATDATESISGSLRFGQRIIVENGVAMKPDRTGFAGSVATTDRLVRTMVKLAGVPLEEAVKMMSRTPARVIGVLDRKGTLEVGKDADIVVFNDDIDIDKTIVGGRVVYSR